MLLMIFFILLTRNFCLKTFGLLDIWQRKEYTNNWWRM